MEQEGGRGSGGGKDCKREVMFVTLLPTSWELFTG